mmetsp:Transcript_52063/g.123208  ORF Transcript_52063/g.123208 Transcript_52063/m.123208 type:complete len:317 (-) Transcript_52063:1991-2941(-)
MPLHLRKFLVRHPRQVGIKVDQALLGEPKPLGHAIHRVVPARQVDPPHIDAPLQDRERKVRVPDPRVQIPQLEPVGLEAGRDFDEGVLVLEAPGAAGHRHLEARLRAHVRGAARRRGARARRHARLDADLARPPALVRGRGPLEVALVAVAELILAGGVGEVGQLALDAVDVRDLGAEGRAACDEPWLRLRLVGRHTVDLGEGDFQRIVALVDVHRCDAHLEQVAHRRDPRAVGAGVGRALAVAFVGDAGGALGVGVEEGAGLGALEVGRARLAHGSRAADDHGLVVAGARRPEQLAVELVLLAVERVEGHQPVAA